LFGPQKFKVVGDCVSDGFTEGLELPGEFCEFFVLQNGGEVARTLHSFVIYEGGDFPSLFQCLLLGEELGLSRSRPTFASAIHLVGEPVASFDDANLGVFLPDGCCLGFLGLQLRLGRFGLHWHGSVVEGVSAVKVVGFLLGVNRSKSDQNAQSACKHWWFASLAQR
jgi:hypothetical protein